MENELRIARGLDRRPVLFGVRFFFSSRRRHTRFDCDWSSDVCSSDLPQPVRLFDVPRQLIMINPTIHEWLNFIARWVHVFAGIMWVGTTYYFTWLDARMTEEEKALANTGKAPQVWMVHSGGFSLGEKQKAPDELSRKL